VNDCSGDARRWVLGIAVGAVVLLAGCGAAASLPSSQLATHAGRPPGSRADAATSTTGRPAIGARPATIVHVPPHWSHTQRAPLVIALHPSGGDPAKFEAKSGWDTVADEHGFLVAYLGSGPPAWKSPANVTYIKAQIASIRALYNIDPRRVYVTGFSAGAYISYFVGCRLSATVAAIAPVSGGMHSQHCKLTRPVSELTIIGTHDIIPLSGTPKFPAPAKVTALWRKLDRCPGKPPKVTIAGAATERVWASCAGGTAVGLYIIAGGRHVYPGSPGLPSSNPDSQYQASEAVWAFFAAHRSRG
jgi:polyhydroxybutyrate depolymerase